LLYADNYEAYYKTMNKEQVDFVMWLEEYKP